MNQDTVRQLKVVELRTELQRLGLSTSGRKEELQNRLIESLVSTGPTSPDGVPYKRSPNSSSTTPHTNETDTKLIRATRFNLEPNEEERKKKRAERFNSVSEDFISEGRLRARQERFGVVANPVLQKDNFEAQKIKRLQRFGLSSK